MSSNNLGYGGAEYLASAVADMRKLKHLYVNDCQMTDKGVKEVLKNLENVESLEILDISGNLIG